MGSHKKQILLTGATGFVGSAVMKRIGSMDDLALRVCARHPANLSALPGVEVMAVENMSAHTEWGAAVEKVETVIHTAARAHIMKDEVPDPLAEYRKVNVEGTLNLARQAAQAGVKRFLFISSIKVNGEQTSSGEPFTADDTPAPEDPYGISKYEAEQGLQQLAQETGLEIVIIRSPLVYGPGVKGNFASMVRLVEKGIPLPLGAIHNKRSLVALDNLVDFIITCIDHPAAANQTFLVADGEDISTTQLLRKTALALGKRPILLPVPMGLMGFVAKLVGKTAVAERLFGSLQVDISKARNLLGWTPPVSVDEGLRRATAKSAHAKPQSR